MNIPTRADLRKTAKPLAAARSLIGSARNSIGNPFPSTNYFVVDPVFLATSSVQPYRRTHDDPIFRPLRIYTLDPSASRQDGAVATLKVPFERLNPGPAGSMMEVVDWDQTTGQSSQPVDLDSARILIENGRTPSPSDAMFRQQMVYAVCASTYDVFRRALGRDPSWGFITNRGGTAKLRIRPQAFSERNAYYDASNGELLFGCYQADTDIAGRNKPGGRVFTSLSHDIIVHEITHALLDGLRPRFRLPTHPDVAAFHEAFSDLVAIFMHFSHSEVVHSAIERSGAKLETDTLLLSLAAQFGHTTGSGGPLRSAICPTKFGGSEPGSKRYDQISDEPHERGSLLVTAMFEAFATVLRRSIKPYLRLAGLTPDDPPGPELAAIVANEASALASRFLSVCIRAIDYCPPFDVNFGEYLRALITADFDLVQEDALGYREAIIDSFAHRGIYANDVQDLAEDSLLWHPPAEKLKPIEALHFRNLKFAADPGRAPDETELRRQAEALGSYAMQPDRAHVFGCALPGAPGLMGDRVEPAIVNSVRSLSRVGPDRQVTFDTVAEITQRRWHKRNSRAALEIFGGSTVILGPDANIRYVIRKSITNSGRIQAQADYLESKGANDTEHRENRRLQRSGICKLFKQNVDNSHHPATRRKRS